MKVAFNIILDSNIDNFKHLHLSIVFVLLLGEKSKIIFIFTRKDTLTL